MVVAKNAQNLVNYSITKVYASMRQITSFINIKLSSFPFTANKTIILEILIWNNNVRPYLPQYYLPPNDKGSNFLCPRIES
jgi:hypothetical protein